jgi:hypothetical protein
MNQQQPQYIRKPLAPPNHIHYAHSLGRGMLTLEQIDELVKPINPAYVDRKQKLTYLSQHQARAEMNRIFGYGNWDSNVDEMTLMYEEQRKGNDGKDRWVVGYRAKVTVNIRDLWGMPVATFSEHHAEENAPQPNRGEAHALALTSVESYALRRALIGLGDRFGLGLYNGGSLASHGQYTIQQYSGQLFEWAPAEAPQPPAPVAVVTHETINAEPVISDDGSRPEEPAQQPQQPVQQQQPQPGVQQTPQMQQFHQVREQLQQDREQARQQPMSPEMQARLQQGLKVDGAQS